MLVTMIKIRTKIVCLIYVHSFSQIVICIAAEQIRWEESKQNGDHLLELINFSTSAYKQ